MRTFIARNLARLGMSAIAGAVVVVAAVGFSAATTDAAPPCLCPDVYAPVTCSNGVTYPNQCVANCRKAKGCVPSGGI